MRKPVSGSPTEPALLPSPRRKRRWARGFAIAAVILLLAFAGLWQIDMVRQTIRIGWMSLTGGLWKLRGHTEKQMMASAALGQKRQVIVYLPPDYDTPANRDRHYPVFYLIHGFPDTGDGWVRWGLAPQLVDQSIVQGSLPPMIVVMPDCHGAIGKFGDGEYLDAPTGAGKPGTRIADFVVHDVPAWTDAHYRTIPTPLGRVLGGESTGGYGAVNLGLQHPDVFATMLSLSGYFTVDVAHFGRDLWKTPLDRDQIRAQSPMAYLPSGTPRQLDAWRHQFVYLGNGIRDYSDVREENARMDEKLAAAQIPYTHHLMPGRHSWDQWRLTLIDALESVRARLQAATDQANPTGGSAKGSISTAAGKPQ